MEKLSKSVIEKSLQFLPGWILVENRLVKELKFATYLDGINFVQELAMEAEKTNHHPDLEVGWCKVRVTFTTHDAEGITEKDIAMAKVVEQLLSTK